MALIASGLRSIKAGADATRAVVKGAWRVWVGADGEDSAQTITIA